MPVVQQYFQDFHSPCQFDELIRRGKTAELAGEGCKAAAARLLEQARASGRDAAVRAAGVRSKNFEMPEAYGTCTAVKRRGRLISMPGGDGSGTMPSCVSAPVLGLTLNSTMPSVVAFPPCT